jgi:hypothetical protein
MDVPCCVGEEIGRAEEARNAALPGSRKVACARRKICDEGSDSGEHIMSLNKLALSALLLASALPAVAQPPAAAGTAPPAAGPEAAIQQAATAFGQCISTGMHAVPASVTPEAGAASVLGGCAAQRQQLTVAVNAMIATLPADQQAAAHAQFESQIGQADTQIAAAIRQQRAAPAAAPATPAH